MHDNVHVENKRSIQHWIDQFKTNFDNAFSESYTKNIHKELAQAGFHRVLLYNNNVWKEMHDWCKQTIGSDYYTWFGHIFWFSCEKDAILFDLKWNHDANN